MRLPIPTRGHAVRAVALMSAVTTAAVFSPLGGLAAGAASGQATDPPAPIITPLAAALVPGPIDIDRKASNVVTAHLEFSPGATSGWHSHPGPVFALVVSGEVTFRHAVNGRCVSDVVGPGHGYLETRGTILKATNRGGTPAIVYATLLLPPGAPSSTPSSPPPACR